MRCEQVQLALSVAMDESGAAPLPSDVAAHAEACPRCSAFSRGAWRIRQAARLEVAPPVPDLVPAIMDRVAEHAEHAGARGPTPLRPAASGAPPAGPARTRFPKRAVAISLAAGLVAGFVVTNGGLIPRRSPGASALASEIPDRLVRAAMGLQGYSSTFDIVERGWAPQVPKRTFVARVEFRAPENLRVIVRDTTQYPKGIWSRNDLALVANGKSWRARGTEPCPDGTKVPCPPQPTAVRTVVGRPPFDQATALPTDVIVPMTVLAASNRVNVIGGGSVGGRPAVAIAVAYENATPLFSYLQFLGSWRPFYPQDQVVVWLDRSTWFPLRYTVYPATGAERARWAAQAGLPAEPPGRSVFSATVRSLSTSTPPAGTFSKATVSRLTAARSRSVLHEGFQELPLPSSGQAAGSLPIRMAGLRLVRRGRFPQTEARRYRESVAAYANGLAWLTVTTVRGWPERRLFGVGSFAQRISVPGGGTGYYEPATSTDARRLALHTPDGELLLETDLPLARLARAASSLPVRGLEQPPGWRIHRWSGGVVEDGRTPADAARAMDFPVLLPGWLPPGYRAAAAETVRSPMTRGLTIAYRRPVAELDGVGLRLYQADGQALPPPTTGDDQAVAVRGAAGRWSPGQHELEWVERGVYRSITAPALPLTTVLRVAGSLRPREAGSR